MGMSAKAVEQLGTGLQRLQEMKRGNRTPRAVRLAIFARENERRTPPALHHARSANADDPAMPAFTLQHQTVGVLQLRRGFHSGVDFIGNALLRLLAVAVELVKLQRHLGRLRSVLLGEQANDALGHVHATGGVEPRSYAERDVTGAQRARAVKIAIGEQ